MAAATSAAEERRLKELQCHYRRLFKDFDFLQGVDLGALSAIADSVKYACHPHGASLFREGDKPDKIFVLLSGEVFIWRGFAPSVIMPEFVDGSLAAVKHCVAIKNMLFEPGSKDAQEAEQPKESKVVKSDEDLGTHCESLGGGVVFGDEAVIAEEEHDSTAICEGPCQVLEIIKEDFDDVLRAEIEKAKAKRLAGPMRQLLVEFPFFCDLDPDVQKVLPEILRYSRHPAGSVLFRQGDPAAQCYIVLNGYVEVWSAVDKGAETQARDEELVPISGKGILRKKCAALVSEMERAQKKRGQRKMSWGGDVKQESLGICLAKLGQGKLFGEVGLLGHGCGRSATIACGTDCDLLVIDKEDFDRVLFSAMSEAKRNLPALVKPLLAEIPFFKELNSSIVDHVPYIVHHCTQPRGTVLWWEEDEPSRCYILLSGKISFWKISIDGDPFAPADEIVGEKEVQQKCGNLVLAMEACESSPPSPSNLKRRDSSYLKQDQVSGARPTNAYGTMDEFASAGVFFGEDGLIENKMRTATATCEDTCHLLYIEKSDFVKLLHDELRKAKMKQVSSHVRRLLKEFHVFEGLTPAVKDILPDIVHYREEERGSVLFQKGDQPSGCYICLSGEVTIWAGNAAAMSDSCSDQAAQEEVVLPPLAPVNPEARERSGQLASMLSSVAGDDRRSPDGKQPPIVAERASVWDMFLAASMGKPLASLGPGSLFGEVALMQDIPRSASVTCRDKSEFLVINRSDFDSVLKREMKRAADEKLEFLLKHVPAIDKLKPAEKSEFPAQLYRFDMQTYPKNHIFMSVGGVSDGAMYIVWDGSVELASHESNGVERRVLMKGSVFGAKQKAELGVTIASASSCNVLRLTASAAVQLPDAVQRNLHDLAEKTLTRRRNPPDEPNVRRVETRGSLSGIVAAFDRHRQASEGPGRAVSPASVRRKAPVGTSGLQIMAQVRPSSRGEVRRRPAAASHAYDKGCRSPAALQTRTMTPPCHIQSESVLPRALVGLFEKPHPEADYNLFQMSPGETLATYAYKPPAKEDWSAGGVKRSKFSYGHGKNSCIESSMWRGRRLSTSSSFSGLN